MCIRDRYDTGDIIPQNTLLLICEKLNLSYFQLLDQQSEENKKDNTEYYKTYMKNLAKTFSNDSLYEFKEMSKRLELLYNFYDDFLLDKNNHFYSCRYKDDKFYIKDNIEKNIVLVLTPSQAEKIIKNAKNYIKFLLFEVLEEKLNK